ncbi:uncharacterized protein LOC115882684 isoform X2 [Sitophilus oryzae]|uniref:Uncharacterized protein LOC115882684 isoform X2 n=1 Tax=Sitophilus oryzae TaxID=7048 RepID=A0A6J2Y1E5_SITOR|nr:uncharacterized protein LOC115882684 isoform X2 [Sitophilus oryzae]
MEQNSTCIVKIPLTKPIKQFLETFQSFNQPNRLIPKENLSSHVQKDSGSLGETLTDMYDLEEQLDYEPPSFNQDEDAFSDQDILSPERHITINNKSDYTPSIASFRDNMTYCSSHINPHGSFRSNYGQYAPNTGRRYIDSSDEDDFTDYELNDDDQLDSGIKHSEESLLNGGSVGDYDMECSESQGASYFEDIDDVNNHIDGDSGLPEISNHQHSPNYTEEPCQPEPNVACTKVDTEKVPEKKSSKNFSITLAGNSRLLSIKKKQFKKWTTPIRSFLKDNVIRLTSRDSWVEYVPRVDSGSDISSTSSSQPSSKVNSTNSMFKLPLKRPPTRQKTNKNLSVSVDLQLNKTKVTSVGDLGEVPRQSPREDDLDSVISLQASTIGIDKEQESIFKCKDEPISASGSVMGTEIVKINRLNDWLQKTQSGSTSPKNINYNDVPNIFKRLCFNFFFTNSCNKNWCKNTHSLKSPTCRLNKMGDLSNEELKKAYGFAQTYPSFFGKVYKFFTEEFAKRDMKNELVHLVSIIFDEILEIDKTEGVSTVLECLEKTDLGSFQESVDYLLLEIGIKQYPLLGSTIFEVICNRDMAPCWPIIRKLVIAGEKLTVKLGKKFLVQLMRMPVDYELCKKVNQLITKYRFINMDEMPSDIVNPFLQLFTEDDPNKELNDMRKNRDTAMERETRWGPVEEVSFPEMTREFNDMRNNWDTAKEPATGWGPVEEVLFPQVTRPATSNQLQTTIQKNLNKEWSLFEAGGFENNEPEQPMIIPTDFSVPPPNFGNLQERNATASTHTENSSRSNFSESGSDYSLDSPYPHPPHGPHFPTKRSYKREGLQYDPTNDYVSAQRKHKFTISIDQNQRRTAQVQDANQVVAANVQENGPTENRGNEGRGNNLANGRGVQTFDQLRVQKRNAVEIEPVNGPGTSNASGSSRRDVIRQDSKLPEHPVFGKIPLNKRYQFNVSLHNLYLEQISQVDINEEDVYILKNSIRNADGRTFLDLVYRYKSPSTVQNFISMTLAHLRAMRQTMARVFFALLRDIETRVHDIFADINLRVILEVIAMNFLFELDAHSLVQAYTDLLLKFRNWDSLVTSRLFINKNVSLMGRYLFIAKLLQYTKPELTYEILVCPTFHLLEHCDKWPRAPVGPVPGLPDSDLQARNNILTEFFKKSYLLNSLVVIQLYKRALTKGIWEFDVQRFVNDMVLDLINRKRVSGLKQVLNEIDLFFNYLAKNTLRGFLVSIANATSITNIFMFFEKCVDKGIYPKMFHEESMQHKIDIKTNMLDYEIEIIIRYYFGKLCELRNLPPGSETIKFCIGLPGNVENNNLQMLESCRSLQCINGVVRTFLRHFFSLKAISTIPTMVEIEKEELIRYLDRARK